MSKSNPHQSPRVVETLSAEAGGGVDRRQAGAWMVLLAAFLGWMFDGLEMGIHPQVAHPALKEFYKTSAQYQSDSSDPEVSKNIPQAQKNYAAYWDSTITAFFLIGAAGGGFVFGWLGDKIGRVKAMTLSILFYSGFTGLCYFANNPWQMGGLRFLAALGMGGEWSLGVALVMEAWPANRRPVLAGLIGAASNVGFMLVGIIGIYRPVTEQTWRYVLVVGALPAVLTFVIRIFVPESEKWQESVRKSGTGKPFKEVFGPQWRGRTLLAIGLAGVALIGTWGAVQRIPTWISFAIEKEYEAKYSANELTLEPLKTQLATTIASNKTNAIVFSSLGAIAGCLVGPLLGSWFNRRTAYAILCVLSFASCMWLYTGFKEFNTLFYAVIFLVGFSTASFYGWLPLYLPELFPTRIRATGQGIAFNFGRVLAAAGAIYSTDLIARFGGYAGMGEKLCLVYLLGIVLIFFCPETKGRPLPE